MENTNEDRAFRFLPDDPSDTDQIGSHEKVRDAIDSFIKDNAGGITIGLVGRYGSGKSTIINMLEDKLQTDKTLFIWCFDAWAHEGDPLRKSFLESLATSLARNKWVDPERWGKKIEELSSRFRKRKTVTIPSLETFGVVFAFSLLVIPLGMVLLRAGLADNMTIFTPSSDVHLQGALGLFFVVLPLCLLGLRGLYLFCTAPRQDPNQSRWSYMLENIGRILHRDKTYESNTYSWESAEPTSIEFERTFSEIMHEAISNGDRRALIVIDNLDRLEPSQALSLWSTIQMFVNHNKSLADSDWMRRVFFLIPYDEDAMSNVLQPPESFRRDGRDKRGDEDRDKGNDRPDKKSVIDPESSRMKAVAVLDKSVSVRYYVPSLMLPDWRDFLAAKLKEAFPGHKESEFHGISLMVATVRGSQSSVPTPRGLKLLVNQIGTLYLHWGHAIPIRHLAYFVVLKRWCTTPIEEALFSKTVPDQSISRLLGKDAVDNLAALLFWREPTVARLVLFEERIRLAVENEQYRPLEKIAASQGGFGHLLESVGSQAIDGWAEESIEILLVLACFANELSDAGLIEKGAFWRICEIIDAEMDRNSVPFPRSDVQLRGISSLLRHKMGLSTLDNFATRVHVSIKEFEEWDEVGGTGFIAEVISECTRICELSKEPVSTDIIPWEVDVDLNRYSELLSALEEGSSGADASRLVRPNQEMNLTEELSKYVNGGELRHFHFRGFHALVKHGYEPDRECLDMLEGVLNPGTRSSGEQVSSAVACLLAAGSPGAERIERRVRNGDLAHQLGLSGGVDDPFTLALLAAVHFAFTPQLEIPAGSYRNKQNRQVQRQSNKGRDALFKGISQPSAEVDSSLVYVLNEFPILLKLISVLEHHTEFGQVVCRSVDRVAGQRGIRGDIDLYQLASRWEVFIQHIGPMNNITRDVCEAPHIHKEVMEWDFEYELIPFYWTLMKVRKSRKQLARWLAEELAEWTEKEWYKTFTEGNAHIVPLIAELGDELPELLFWGEMRKGVEQHASDLISVDDESEFVSIEEAIRLFPDSHLEVLGDSLARLLYEKRDAVSDTFLEKLGHRIAESERFRSDDRTISDFLEPAVREETVPILRWVQRCLKRDKSLLDMQKEPYRRTLVESIERRVSGQSEDEVTEILREILRVLEQVDP